jgi:PAS domain S-box-containing protein
MTPRAATVRVLLVEDDRVDRMAIERHVLRQGLPYEVESARSGAEALHKLKEHAFDLVLVDYMLGDMTGLELLPELRGTPAIFISGMGNEEVAVRALHQGAYDYLVKDPERAYLQVLPVVMRNALSRRRAEDSLRESQRTIDTLLRNLPGMAYRARPDAEMALEFVSAGCLELTGYSTEELAAEGFGLRRLLLPEDRPGHEQALRLALERGGSYELSYRIQPRTGAPKWVWERGRVVPGAHFGPPALEGFLSDITGQKQTEEALRLAKDAAEQAAVLRDKFISLVAHDLRVPLTACSLAFQMLREELAGSLQPRHGELFETLVRNSQTMLRMIDDLLLVSRLQSGALQPKPRFLQPATLRAALAGLEPLVRQKGIALRVELPDSLRVYADPELLGEVLQNLVANAVKFTPSGGSITVSAAVEDGPVITIQDSGVGMDAARLQQVLAPEAYSSTPGTAGEKGTGLGVRICREILTAHKGHLTIESRPGAGTTVRVFFPPVRPSVLAFGLSAAEGRLLRSALAGLGVELQELPAADAPALHSRGAHLIVAGTEIQGEQLGALAAARTFEGGEPIPMLALASRAGAPSNIVGPVEVLPGPVEMDALRERLRHYLG